MGLLVPNVVRTACILETHLLLESFGVASTPIKNVLENLRVHYIRVQ